MSGDARGRWGDGVSDLTEGVEVEEVDGPGSICACMLRSKCCLIPVVKLMESCNDSNISFSFNKSSIVSTSRWIDTEFLDKWPTGRRREEMKKGNRKE